MIALITVLRTGLKAIIWVINTILNIKLKIAMRVTKIEKMSLIITEDRDNQILVGLIFIRYSKFPINNKS